MITIFLVNLVVLLADLRWYILLMSAYDFTDEEIDELTKAMQDRLDRLPLHPKARLKFPDGTKGKDIYSRNLATEMTLQVQKRNDVN